MLDLFLSCWVFFQGDSGSPLMCKVDSFWFQAAVLSFESNTTSKTRQDSVMVLTKLSNYERFLTETVGTFLSPTSTSNTTSNSTSAPNTTNGGAPAHSPFFLFFHLLVLFVCLRLFSQKLYKDLHDVTSTNECKQPRL